MPTTNKPENATGSSRPGVGLAAGVGEGARGKEETAKAPSAPAQGAALVYATFPSQAEAERVGADLVDRRLAACVNIFPGMVSIYVWDGARQRESEVAMLIKTRAEMVATVVDAVRVLHPYSNPALLALPVIGGSADFLGWITAQTSPAPRA